MTLNPTAARPILEGASGPRPPGADEGGSVSRRAGPKTCAHPVRNATYRLPGKRREAKTVSIVPVELIYREEVFLKVNQRVFKMP